MDGLLPVVGEVSNRGMAQTRGPVYLPSVSPVCLRRSVELILLVGVVILYAASPITAWIAGGLLFATYGRKTAAIVWSFASFMPIALVINGSKEVAGDWAWYWRQFFEYQGLGLLDIFGKTMFPYNKLYEPLYFSSSWIIANIVPGQVQFLIFWVLLLVYGNLTGVAFILSRYLELNAFRSLVLLYILFGFGITFTLVTHLVRQSIAVSLCTLAFILLLKNNRFGAALVAVLAVAIHTPAWVLAGAIFLGSHVFRRYGTRSFLGMATMGLILGGAYWWFSGRGYAGANDGSVSLLVISVDLLVLVGLLWGVWKMPEPFWNLRGAVASVMILQLAFVLGTILEPLPALRFYLYVTPFTSLGAFALIDALLAKRLTRVLQAAFTALVGVGAVFLMQTRIMRAPFYFGIDIFDMLVLF